MEIERTGRGFPIARFRDLYRSECSIQDSSLANQPAVWVGVDSDFDGGKSARMHLTQDQAAALISLLQRFIDKGTILP